MYAIQRTSQALTGGALSYEWTLEKDMDLLQVLLKASVNITETVQVLHVDGTDANYTILLDSTSLTAAQNYAFRPTGRCAFKRGDKIKVTCTNANLTGTVYAKIIAEEKQ